MYTYIFHIYLKCIIRTHISADTESVAKMILGQVVSNVNEGQPQVLEHPQRFLGRRLHEIHIYVWLFLVIEKTISSPSRLP